MSEMELDETPIELPPPFASLATRIDQEPESLAVGNEAIRIAALQAAKHAFDLAVKSEVTSRAQVTELLKSLAPSEAPRTRSQAKLKDEERALKQRQPPVFGETFLNELCTDNMDEDQVWAQLELRTGRICEVLEFALEATGEVDDSILDNIGIPAGLRDDEETEELDDSDEFDDLDGSVDKDEDEDMDSDDEEEEEEDEPRLDGGESDEEEADLGEAFQDLRDPSDESDIELDAPPPSRTKGRKGKGTHGLDDGFFDLVEFNAETEEAEARRVSKGHLGRSSNLEEDEDENEDAELEDVDLFAPVDGELQDESESPELFYKDFFVPPSKPATANKPPPQKKAGGVRFHDKVRVKNIKAKGKNMSLSTMYDLAEDDEDSGSDEQEEDEGVSGSDTGSDSEGDDDDGQEEESSEEDEGSEGEKMSLDGGSQSSESLDPRETIERIRDDLFADDEEQENLGLSTHESRMQALRDEIATLETENIADKHWTLMGEATSRSRPQNALLEEDLEFERVMKSVPVITEELVHSLEERIKARIEENRFDDVVRKRPVDDKPFLPSRFFELQDTKSKQSLAEIYEGEYSKAKSGSGVDDRDGKLAKEHEEISQLWDSISSKLDALCNAHFTPKAPKASISTVANISAATIESALPTTKATSAMLAPEEVFTPSSSDLRARSELTPAQKRALHNKEKKTKQKYRDALEKSVDMFAKNKGPSSVKKQKEAALKSVVKNGKGITVIGKKSKGATDTNKGKA